VRLAQVELISSSGGRSAVTDDAGGFVFESLPAGGYTVRVSKSGYLSTEYGQVRPGTNTRGRLITLKDGEQITRLTVPISQGGSIAGVVRDDRGEPVYRATVRASRLAMSAGSRVLEEVESTETDERGVYRIGLLPSRQYIIGAIPPGDAIPESVSKTSRLGYAPVFHPDTLSTNAAEPIALGVGEHRAGVDLVMPLVKLSTITGRVVGSDGQPVPNYSVTLMNDGTEDGATTDEQGRFTFERVAPGNYTLKAGLYHIEYARFDGGSYQIMGKRGAGGFVFDTGVLRADVDLAVKLDDVAFSFSKERKPAPMLGTASAEVSVNGDVPVDTTLRLEPPRTISGRVLLEGTQPRPQFSAIEVVLHSVGNDGGSSSAKVAADGTFTFENVAPGRYTVHGNSPATWMLARATAGGVDALETHLEIPRDRDVRDLTLTFRDRRTQLTGTILDSSPNPATDRVVIVFPTDERLWIYGSNRILSAPVGEGGRYEFDGLRAGSYRLAVVTGAEPDEWLQPEFLQQLLGASIPITIVDGEKKTQDLRVK
jgi:hypothetical protein